MPCNNPRCGCVSCNCEAVSGACRCNRISRNPDIVINISVQTKNKTDPNYGTGSDFTYTINGVQGGILNLYKNTTYKFILDQSTSAHQFYFTTSSVGGSGAPGAIPSLPNPVTSGTTLMFNNPALPSMFYYQCGIHPSMGGPVRLAGGDV